MKTFSLLAVILTLGLSLGMQDADAANRRFGGGKSIGMQKQTTAAPVQNSAMTPTKPPVAAAAPTPQKRSWMGPLAGLAAGLGLAALASHFGFGEELANMMMIGLLVMAGLAVVGFLMRKKAQGMAAGGNGGLQYAGMGNFQPQPNSNAQSFEGFAPGGTSAAPVAAAVAIPADFDVAGFVRNAKVGFIRLQAANDAGNLADIREFTTPEVFAEVQMSIAERGQAPQETEVVSLNAEVLEVAEEAGRYVVSVRFTGLIREDKAEAAMPIDEVWHLVKPTQGAGGWVVAGIQQTA